LDADDTSSASMTLSGNNVSVWKDKSGTGNNALANTGTVTTNSTALNGRNTIRFSASSFLNIASFAMTANFSVFAVLRGVTAQGNGNAGYFFLGNGAQPSFFVYTLQPQFGNISGPYSAWFASTGETNWYMPSTDFFLNNPGFIYTDNNSSFVNGSQLTFNPNRAPVPNPISAGTYGIQVGGRVQADSLAFDFAECIFYNATLTAAQRQQTEGYLAQKWGLRNNLPGGHPGITTTIYPSRRQAIMAAVPYYTQFSPTSISGCKIWLDAADSATFTLNGSTVSTWMDKTGNGFNVSQATAGSQPTRGSNEVVFNGSTSLQYSGSVGIFGNSYTSYVIHTPTNNTNYQQGVISIKDSTTGFDFEIGQFYVWTSAGSIYHLFSASVNSKTILGINSTTSLSLNYSINGQPFAVSGAGWYGVSSGSSLLIGNSQFSGIGFIGTINEYLLFTRTLTATEHDQITGYLASKWGSQVNLPSNHPNKTFSTGTPNFTQNVFRQVKRTIGSTNPINPTAKYSAFFNNGSNTFLSIPASSSLTLGTNNHTIEFWMYQISRGQYDVPFAYGKMNPQTATTNYYINCGSGGFGLAIGNGAGGWAVQITGAARSLNEWHHYAIVRNGNTFTVYDNGTSVGSVTASINIPAQGDVFRVGSDGEGYGIINGYISNFRLVNGTAVYTSNFTPPTSPLTAIPNTQILIQGITDRSPNAFTLTNNGGVTLSTSISPFA
jgi:hypothetical protein